MLRSLRFSEADRILHLYTRDRGRIGAIAKGVRKTKSRFGARLEPLSHVELMLHEGSGELHTVTGVELIGSHHAAARGRLPAERRPDRRRGDAAPLRRARGERARVRRAHALPRRARRRAAARRRRVRRVDPLALSFQLKLLWVSGYLPHVTTCVECGAAEGLVGFSPRAGGAVCARARRGARSRSRPRGSRGIEQLLSTPLADAAAAGLSERARREALAVVTLVATRSTGASGCGRSRREAGARRRLRARRRRGADRRRGGPPLHLARSRTGRPGGELVVQERLVREASRVVGLYHDGRQVGFCRAATAYGLIFVYLADVYVLPGYRGRGLGVELVREMIDARPVRRRAAGCSTRRTRTSSTRSSASARRAGG